LKKPLKVLNYVITGLSLEICLKSAGSLVSLSGMYMEAGLQHHTAHFHAYYQDEVAVFGISPVELLSGSLPRKQVRLVEAWAE